jgi:hypothetical protein
MLNPDTLGPTLPTDGKWAAKITKGLSSPSYYNGSGQIGSIYE